MIRWGRLLLLLVPLLLIWGGAHFFLDRGIERAIESAGTAAVGARVDVGGVRTSFWRLSAVIRGLAVTDPDAPMTNAVEVESIRLNLATKPLFWKKFIVEEASIRGIRTGTPRKRSGALPKKYTPEARSAVSQAAQAVAGTAWENLKSAYDPKALVSKENLASYRRVLDERDRLAQWSDDVKARANALDPKGLAERAEALAKKAKGGSFSGVEGIARAQSLLQEGNALKKELSRAQKDIKTMGTEVTQRVADAKSTVQDIDRLRRQDLDKVMAQVKSGFSTEGLVKGLLGPVWFARVEGALRWVERARKLAGYEEKGQAAPPPPVRKGKDIVFPFRHRWPTFHIRRAALSGVTPRNLTYEGTLANVTSDPKLLGLPLTVDLAGAAGERTLKAATTVDLTTDTPRQSVEASLGGLPLTGFKLGQLEGGPLTIAEGRGSVDLRLQARGESLAGAIALAGAGLRLDRPAPAKTSRTGQLVDGVLQGVREGRISVQVSGTVKEPRLQLTTSLDNQLREAVKGALDQETAKLRAEVEKEIQSVVAQETERLSTLVQSTTDDALQKLRLQEKDLDVVEQKIDEALNKLTGAGSLKIPNLKGLFK